MIELYLLLVLMIAGAIIAVGAKDLISAVISLGAVGFGLVLVFLILQAPDLAITQIVVATLTLIIFIVAILKTTREDISPPRRIFVWATGVLCLIFFLAFFTEAVKLLPQFGEPILRVARHYIAKGVEATGAANLVSAVMLDFRGYDTFGGAAVLFTAVVGVVVVLRKIGRRK